MRLLIAILTICFTPALAQDPPAPQQPPQQQGGEIRLLVRADDMGAAQSVNEACIRTAKDGIARSVEVIVPGPWFLDAVRLLKENPSIDVGVHLTLTSEWERVKWRPVTHAPSLVDADGYFFPMTSQRRDFPEGTAFLQAKWKLDEVERELRAQIELAKKHLPRISHVSAHMGAATAAPELRAVTAKLAKEFNLRLETPGLKRPPVRWSGNTLTAEQKEDGLVRLIEALTPGDWLVVEHPALDTPEMRNIAHKGYENVAADRDGVTRAFLSARAKEVIARRGIKLISYADLPAPRPDPAP
jgi:predicted glycoside hydrolase/deacetylase ChbG (UPF0249 family)